MTHQPELLQFVATQVWSAKIFSDFRRGGALTSTNTRNLDRARPPPVLGRAAPGRAQIGAPHQADCVGDVHSHRSLRLMFKHRQHQGGPR